MAEIPDATTRARANRRLWVGTILGALFFLLPVRWEGTWTVPFDVAVSFITDNAPTAVEYYCLLVIVGALVLTGLAYTPWGRSDFVAGFRTSAIMAVVRAAGAVFAVMIVFGVGPSAVLAENVGGLMYGTLVASVGVIVPIGAVFITLFVAFGGLELVGTLARPVMRPLFRVPGRGALDALASFIGSYSVGLYVTNRMYLESRYTARESVVIATCFSTVSLGFFGVVASTLDLLRYFGLLLVVVMAVSVVLGVILCRIPPLSRVPDEYVGEPHPEPEPAGSITSAAVRAGRERAAESRPLAREGARGLIDGVRLVMIILPAILAVGVVAILIAEHTPVFEWLGAPLEPLLRVLGVPNADVVGQASVLGISEMFLPALLSVDIALPARFFVAALSLSQIFFFSATIPLLVSLDLPVKLWHCLVLFVLRTLIAIPILAGVIFVLF